MLKRFLISMGFLCIVLDAQATTSSHKKLAKLVKEQSVLLNNDLSTLENLLLSNQNNSVNLFFSTQNLNAFIIKSVTLLMDGNSISHLYSKDELLGLKKGALHPLFNHELAHGEYDLTIKISYVRNTTPNKVMTQFFKTKLEKTSQANMFNIRAYQSSDKSPLIIGIVNL